MKIYDFPLYYEIAFSFFDVKKQIDLFERFIKRYSRIKVKRVLDIACGPSLQLREMATRGYKCIGMDINSAMLNYLKQKAKEQGAEIETIKADMTDFKLKNRVDFTFIMMGSFGFKDNQELLRHLDCVANVLKSRGLYLIENMYLDWVNFKSQNWIMKKNGITVKARYEPKPIDALSQTFKEMLTLEVRHHNKRLWLQEKEIFKVIYPQEFLALLKLNGKFEFLGWFERYKFRKLRSGNNNNIVLLRRK
ncbi:MAG: class I SAM-dependent methyltransferase [candidate division WOR-3 bacterium]|nr:class I SAM-dependent methyltransferase [candidate division WOR-3 bacterium]